MKDKPLLSWYNGCWLGGVEESAGFKKITASLR